MAKVIVERPRLKPFNSRKGRQQDHDDLPAREGMRRGHAWRGDRKRLNENLAPLRRYLASQVGRPWDKVYADICANLRVDNTVQQHVRDHLRDFVAIKPRRHVQGWRSSVRGGLWWQAFYVDQTTGILRRTDLLPEEKARRRARRNRPAPPVERIALADDLEHRLLGGIWYEVRLAPLPEPVYRATREIVRRLLTSWKHDGRSFEAEMEVRCLVSPQVKDVVTGKELQVDPLIDAPESWQLYRRAQPDRRYAVSKRVLSRKELRRADMRNTDETPQPPAKRRNRFDIWPICQPKIDI